jgi:pimeloyl-ACP methyl ester carboxylesterase
MVSGAVALSLAAFAAGLPEAAPVPLKTTEFGRGPALVLLHDLCLGRMVWMPTARKLLAGHRVVMVDLPGHGETPLPDPFSLEACAEALDQVLARHKADSTVLVAHGVGGLIAFHLVQAHPDRIKGLIVIDAPTRSSVKVPEQQQTAFFRQLDLRYDEILKRIVTQEARDSLQGLELHAMAQAVPPATVKAYFRAIMNADASGVLKKMKPAFLLVASSKAWPAEKEWPVLAREWGYDDPAAIATRRVAHSGALIMKEQPDTLAAVVAEFAARAMAGKK